MKTKYTVVSFYCFTSFNQDLITNLRNQLLELGKESITGLLILAEEGINGTVCGEKQLINQFFSLIKYFVGDKDLNKKISYSEKNVYKRLKVKIKLEVVTMGQNDIDNVSNNGTYLDSFQWNEFLEDENTLIIDTRNKYEINLGSFEKAINPNTDNFKEFPEWVDKHLEQFDVSKKETKIGMFCTGGIRCEKATSLLKLKGYKNVFHLKGGILKYLETIPNEKNLYKGECYVFDDRVSVDHNLNKGSYTICHACGWPVSDRDKTKPEYIEGIQCHFCIEKFTDQDRKRFAERQKQFDKRRSNSEN
tara:strand:- start:282 stop:1196 length:915 start_codon:yes stop_codon:yes gene_type:complete